MLYRIRKYYSENGLIKTIMQLFVVFIRQTLQNKYIIWVVDPNEFANYDDKHDYVFVCKTKYEMMTKTELFSLENNGNRNVNYYKLKSHFDKGATLWIVKLDDDVLGFVWSIKGKTYTPYYFPIGPNDVQLFDAEVFTKFRGKALSKHLFIYVLNELSKQNIKNLYTDTAIWNIPIQRTLSKLDFNKIGLVRKFVVLNKAFVIWSKF